MQRLSDLSQLHDELMKDPKYRRLYEAEQKDKAYEERQQHLRDLAKMVDTIGYDRLAELVQADSEGRAVVLPAGKIGDYVEWDTGVSVRLFQIQGILIEPDGVRYDLGDLAPFVNHKNINRILTRAEAEAKGERE